MARRIVFALALLAAMAGPARADQDMTGLWVASFMGNTVECHLEQRGQSLYGAAFVTGRTGAVNTYHVAGVIMDGHITAVHGSGHIFQGVLQGEDKLSGELTFKDGPTVSLQASRTKRGKTHPHGLAWPKGFGPAQ
jgi:hypothetical protein